MKSKFNFVKSNLFYKYLLSHLLVLILPFTFIIYFNFNYFVNILRTSIIKNNQDMLIQIKDVIDTQLNNIENISVQISQNKNLAPYAVTKNFYKAKNAMSELNQYTSSNNFLDNLCLYIHGNNFIYSPYSTYSISRFINDTYQYTNWEISDFVNTLDSCNNVSIRSAEDVKINKHISSDTTQDRYITYITPIPPYSYNPYGTVLFQIKEDSFRTLMKNILKNYNGNTIVLDNSGKIITYYNKEDYIFSEDFLKLTQLTDTDKIGWKNVKLNKQDYLFCYVTSNKSNWSYITLIPMSQIMSKVSHIKFISFIAIILITLLSTVIIFHITKANYYPIKELKDFTQSKCGVNLKIGDELDTIRLAVDHMSNINKNLSDKVERNHLALKDYVLFKLIKGDFFNIKDFNSMGKEIKVVLTKNHYFIAVFYIDDISINNKLSLIDFVENNLPSNYEGYVKDSIEPKLFTLIASTNEKSETVEQDLNIIKNNFNSSLKSNITIAVGNLYTTPNQIGKSYIEALTALNYRLVYGNNQVIAFYKIPNTDYEIDFLIDNKIRILETAIKQGNTEIIASIIEDIISVIQKQKLPLFLVRCICYDIINSIIKTMHEINAESVINKDNYPDVVSLMQFETVDELKNIVEKISYDICNNIKTHSPSSNSNYTLKDKTILYINNNYNKYSFSIQNMCDEFNVSAAYLSRYFRQQTGKTISDYVNYLRIEKAKELLEYNDKPLQELVKTIGYQDVSSFIRKFKKLTGITPGKYRKIYNQKNL